MLAYTWMDRERGYFITTALLLEPGKAYQHIRWRQREQMNIKDDEMDQTRNNEDDVQQILTSYLPKAS